MTRIADDLCGHVRPENIQLYSSTRQYVGWIILFSYPLFLTFQGLSNDGDNKVAGTLVRELQDWPQIVSWIYWLFLRVCREVVCFVPIGFTAVLVVGQCMNWLLWFPINLPGLAIGGVLTALVCAIRIIDPGHQSAIVTLIFPVLGCMFGAWAGTTWSRGWRSRLWFIPKTALLATLILSSVGMTV
ncbi:MAG: hypothetical protein GY845_36965 [Planctomycetes bacterium]|nr:hypothetical protein [Planctomycetota bacterium]